MIAETPVVVRPVSRFVLSSQPEHMQQFKAFIIVHLLATTVIHSLSSMAGE